MKDSWRIPTQVQDAFTKSFQETKTLNVQRQPQLQEALKRENVPVAELEGRLRELAQEKDLRRVPELTEAFQVRYHPILMRAQLAAGIPSQKNGLLVPPQVSEAVRKAVERSGPLAIKKAAELQVPERLSKPPYNAEALWGIWNRQRGDWVGGEVGQGALGFTRGSAEEATGEVSLDMRSYLAPGNYGQVLDDPAAAIIYQQVLVPKGTRRMRITVTFEPLSVDIWATAVLGYANAEAVLHVGGRIPGVYPVGSTRDDIGARFSQDLRLGHIRCPGFGSDRIVETRLRTVTCEVLLEEPVRGETETALRANAWGYVTCGIYGWCVSAGGAYANTIVSAIVRQIEVQYWSE